jgi:phosphate uptake regulator
LLSKEYLETARTLHRVALKVTDRALANQLRAIAEDCERRAEQAALADAARASAREGLNSPSPKSRSSARLQAARAVRLAERTLERIEDPAGPSQERAQRKRRLTKGPFEFREDRIDQPEGYCPVAQADGAEAGNSNPSLVRDWQAQ